jgi:hypothetical protein
MKEADLYPPLKQFLEARGYSVHGEVKNCDLVARKGDEVIIVEMKKRMTVSLLCQIARRKDVIPAVYAAVPVPPGKKEIPRYGEVRHLLRRLETGLILVRFMKTRIRVEVVQHPREYELKTRQKRRASIIREISGRYAEFTPGGSPSDTDRITAYKQTALLAAWFLHREGPLTPARLRDLGLDGRVQQVLSGNLYGWFDRVTRGVYKLSPEGSAALKYYRDTLKKLVHVLEKETT